MELCPGDLLTQISHQAAGEPTSFLHMTPEGGRLHDALPS